MSTPPAIRVAFENRLSWWIGLGIMVLGGLAIIVALVGVDVVAPDVGSTRVPMNWFLGCTGFAALSVASLAVLCRRGVSVDSERRFFSVGWSWLFWNRHTVFPITSTGRVVLRREVLRSANRRYEYVVVQYLDEDADHELTRTQDFHASRAHAERAARAIGCPILDLTGSLPTQRLPADLDRSVADAASLPPDARWRRLPDGARGTARWADGELTVASPAPNWPAVIVGVALGALLTAYLGHATVHGITAGWFPTAALGLVSVAFGCLTLLALYEFGICPHRARVTTQGVWLHRWPWDHVGRLVPADQIEEVDSGADGTGVRIQGDGFTHTVVFRLRRGEGHVMRDMIHLTLVGRPPRS